MLAPGPLGAFDDSGAMGSCLVCHDDRELLYFIGWNTGVTVPFTTFIGCAVAEDGRFERVSLAPVVGRTDADPFLATSPWVLVEEGRWRMWYASGVRWTADEGGRITSYRIVSRRSPKTASPGARPATSASTSPRRMSTRIARPCVIRDADRYRMWFSHRGPAYSIGYAESDDGLTWQRDDERGGLRPAG